MRTPFFLQDSGEEAFKVPSARRASPFLPNAMFAQTSSIRSFFDCQIPLTPILIMFTVLVVIMVAGDRIEKKAEGISRSQTQE